METDRLCLVDFTDLKSDNHLDGLATMNGDAEVMEFFPATLSQAESAAMLQRLIDHRAAHGYAPFALHKKDDNAFIGFTGLMLADFEAQFYLGGRNRLAFCQKRVGAGVCDRGGARLFVLWL